MSKRPVLGANGLLRTFFPSWCILLMLSWFVITRVYVCGFHPHRLLPTSIGAHSSLFCDRNSRVESFHGDTQRRSKRHARLFGERGMEDKSRKEELLPIDCRSDTVTRPTKIMRDAMTSAVVGDDVFEDDYTVKELEDRVANMFHKESALYFPTGTMCNLAAIMSWCGTRGAEMILGDKSHIFLYEQGGMSQIAGVVPRTIQNAPNGTLPLDEIEDAIRVDNVHCTTTELIALENTHNYYGGRILSPRYTRQVGKLAKEYGIPLHIDGARIWNAATKLGVSPLELTAPADSVSVCLSKGLGAPCGSVLLGPSSFIQKARRVRKVLGGGMRQVGVVAAAGMVALDDYEAGILVDDHIRAKVLADAIAKLPGFQVNVDDVETNIVLIEMSNDHDVTPAEVAGFLEEQGVLVIPFGPNNVRLVVHRDITDNDIVAITEAFKSVTTLHLWPRPNATALSIPERQTKRNTTIINTASTYTVMTDKTAVEGKISTNEGNNVDAELGELEGKSSSKEIDMMETQEEIFLEEAVIHGMSLGDDGFSVILRGLVCDRFIRVIITPYDPMSEGLDQEQPDTPEAVTLLQLLQGIDVESHLAKDYLSSLCKIDMQGADPTDIKRCNANVLSLYRAQILHTYAPSNKMFEGLFKLRSAESSSSVKDASVMFSSKDEDDTNINERILPTSGSGTTSSVNINDERADAAHEGHNIGDNYEQTSKVIANTVATSEEQYAGVVEEEPEIDFDYIEDDNIDKDNVTVFTTRNTAQGLVFAEKDMDCKNAFEFIALAIRHNAIIEARSSLFHQEDLSFTAEQLPEYFPKLVEANPEARSSNRRNYNFYDLNCEVDRLQRLYEESVRQGNVEKAEIILDKIDTLTDEVDGFALIDEGQQENQKALQVQNRNTE